MDSFIFDHKVYYNPVEFAFAHIGGTWKMSILICLRDSGKRYGEIKILVPHITDKMLYTQLRELEGMGLLTRTVYQEKPPKVEYALTKKGERALPVIDRLVEYGEELMSEVDLRILAHSERSDK
ncbi:winged helix-turn-helix transcriptional regulator [Dyadobacter crusticola]|uniref:winged helix-turn-helix transcriptional regulator n=1 Tax=Dyadobacter crusticola TaxID=292407 RepID=UPI0004E28083|nr:helix-turn-helix domain-containing protein [Dyadobacter crusticola]